MRSLVLRAFNRLAWVSPLVHLTCIYMRPRQRHIAQNCAPSMATPTILEHDGCMLSTPTRRRQRRLFNKGHKSTVEEVVSSQESISAAQRTPLRNSIKSEPSCLKGMASGLQVVDDSDDGEPIRNENVGDAAPTSIDTMNSSEQGEDMIDFTKLDISKLIEPGDLADSIRKTISTNPDKALADMEARLNEHAKQSNQNETGQEQAVDDEEQLLEAADKDCPARSTVGQWFQRSEASKSPEFKELKKTLRKQSFASVGLRCALKPTKQKRSGLRHGRKSMRKKAPTTHGLAYVLRRGVATTPRRCLRQRTTVCDARCSAASSSSTTHGHAAQNICISLNR